MVVNIVLKYPLEFLHGLVVAFVPRYVLGKLGEIIDEGVHENVKPREDPVDILLVHVVGKDLLALDDHRQEVLENVLGVGEVKVVQVDSVVIDEVRLGFEVVVRDLFLHAMATLPALHPL